MRSRMSTGAAVVVAVDVATLIGVGARGLIIPLHIFNSLLAIGIVSGLSLVLPPMLAGEKDEDRASNDYLRGVHDGAAGR